MTNSATRRNASRLTVDETRRWRTREKRLPTMSPLLTEMRIRSVFLSLPISCPIDPIDIICRRFRVLSSPPSGIPSAARKKGQATPQRQDAELSSVRDERQWQTITKRMKTKGKHDEIRRSLPFTKEPTKMKRFERASSLSSPAVGKSGQIRCICIAEK